MRPGVYCLLAGQGLSLYPVLTDPRSSDSGHILMSYAPLDQGSVLPVRVFGSLSIYFTPQVETR